MVSYAYFELNESPERQQEYRDLMLQHSIGIKKSAEYLLRGLQLMQAARGKDKQYYHGIVFLLARHVAEEVDAASVLVAEGCVDPCKLHLRSAFEAELGVLYILEADSERRAIAYLVKHARERVRWYEKTDPKSPAGRSMRSRVASDPIALDVLSSLPSFDFDTAKDRLRGILQRPPYAAVNEEWQRIKKDTKRHPAWHALFGGPKTIHDLAFHLNRGFWYEYLYSDWSGHVHAGTAVRKVGPNTDDPTGELKSFRPLRHPDGLKDAYSFGQTMSVSLGTKLADKYLSQIGRDDLRNFYMREIKPRNDRLKHVSINAEWR